MPGAAAGVSWFRVAIPCWAQVVSELEARAPWVYRPASTLTRPRWGREPLEPGGFRWWKQVQGGDTLLGAGGE